MIMLQRADCKLRAFRGINETMRKLLIATHNRGKCVSTASYWPIYRSS